MKFNFFGNTLKYASTCRRRRIAAVHHPGTHTSPPRWRFCHAARTRTRPARCVFLLAVGDRAAFPPTPRRQPHLHRGNGGEGPPDVSLEIFFDTAWEWLVAVVCRPVSPVPPPFTTPPPIVLSDAHRGLYPSFLRSSFGALRCFPPSIMCFSFRMFARLPGCFPVLAPPSPPPPPLLTPLPSSPLFFHVSRRLGHACVHAISFLLLQSAPRRPPRNLVRQPCQPVVHPGVGDPTVFQGAVVGRPPSWRWR